MQSKWDAIKGSAGFFITMAVCLVVIGISGYYLLLDDRETTPEPQHTPPVETTAITPESEIQVIEEEPETVEVLAPDPVPVSAPTMPEAEIDDTPVIAEAPRLIVTPVHGEVLMAFSMDELTYNPTMEDWRTHDGMDIEAASGTTVLAACNGTVHSVEDDAFLVVFAPSAACHHFQHHLLQSTGQCLPVGISLHLSRGVSCIRFVQL